MIKIEKGISLPKKIYGPKADYAIAIKTMEINDSFVYEKSYHPGSMLTQYAKKIGREVSVRKISDGVYRVWRIK